MLPKSITARRIGHWSYGSESEYDADGEQAPITWICNCGSRIKLEKYVWDRATDWTWYEPTPKEELDEFLAKHGNCEPRCYKCQETLVDRQGDWCQPCEEYSYSRPDWINDCDDPSQDYNNNNNNNNNKEG